MLSSSCLSLLELSSVDMLDFPPTPRNVPRAMTASGIVSDKCRGRTIIVANLLPVHAKKDPDSGRWNFSFDDDSLLLQLKDGFSSDVDVVYVGSLKVDVNVQEQEEISQKLLEEFNCVPTFVPTSLQKQFYHGFCKQNLWPLFHYMMPISSYHGSRFDRPLWLAYLSANKRFADKVMEVINLEEDYVWIHDYHLMVLPTFLRKRYSRIKLGFFLHSPFPSSEIFRTLPVRDEILKALLNTDLIGFHTFSYAHHFLSCCSRLLGLEYESKRGYLTLEYFGRTIYIKILPVGVHMGRLEFALNHSHTSIKAKEIKEDFKGKKVILGVDDMDIFKGIGLKLLAMEKLLNQHPELRGNVVLVQILNPARSNGNDVLEAKRETYEITKRINKVFGFRGYEPVILIDHPIPFHEKIAYYVLAECCIVNALRDGMNLVPYEYIVCRQGTSQIDQVLDVSPDSPHTSTIVVSEFIGCSPSLSGAVRVNPWDFDAVAEALYEAVAMPALEKQLRHEKHYRYISSHDVAYWARSFSQDLERACQDHYSKRCWGIGLGLGFRILSLSPSFRKLSIEHIGSAYRSAFRRAIFLDYDGTVVSQASLVKSPTPEVISILNDLCKDSNNTVFIVSGRGKDTLGSWFDSCKNLGLAAEHGYYLRWNRDSEWEVSTLAENFGWKRIAEPVMKLYTEATDGSSIEPKDSALVWHHRDADPCFGSCQAMELLDHLENVLANEPVVVKRGHQIVEVKPQGVTKGLVAERVLSTMIASDKAPDFVMCIGDDRSDEDMFESISCTTYSSSLAVPPKIFACTVGQKPSKAKYYLDDTTDVLTVLQSLATSTSGKLRSGFEARVLFEDDV
ncbi:probable alpha,alpha-trehalose-phosphate synthase [UDP-forming] 10 isoform X1 [Cucurbita pepo subsp. pepo]|uniref:probable alpha,alpha-trehalose-phosphate synthase [UDP-forming] 10 isoform X1 n=1 Tax=Cucurbita pepo subsp. pepo TaxID=3664 RepID=UPI000C9D4BEA|nr:probable alpha,alpha-trehalose-phosphate synthase [UDP-forming] 10 isoform X1 [Cucurbita pepo subsp. pepo]XP_023529279.1 probable alpha,alpha-trehalose-phosphate synthase [UDP-forming] 10 isoform X1 [Cucurbita pepo subsp. pepo]XP_023529280.1 probable alpha,alpha-trehalose-phosphate synthase [UDP-forming] 10 isoform X1 [Cucurbita pepo subsp. pepo]XP_023529281.1 probable alpha,alpha-trehalose-phosphate synthase [UDP-forming] 10 isoform X1 [Cucurbita pepo subsp. pepo]XP_023529282.1 probable alp